ncbi:N-acylphosphatidylethanolamine synthase isoform X1 [Sesamum indicum]|uniref:Tafazzin family protein n=1 Tax=Sesamum indicum TaxID=4182 RepID=A0A6I9UIY9_SESIN|nr:N-acylphosphatidylethanolamine synthase isoform X1 [Sesamum indicum]
MGGERRSPGRNTPEDDVHVGGSIRKSCGQSSQYHHGLQPRNPPPPCPAPPTGCPSSHCQQSYVHVSHSLKLDDPVMWGLKDFPVTDAESGRWVLAAEDICFKNPVLSYLFRLGKCIPITRGGGIYQEHMNEALDRLIDGAWLHTFPEGKVCQEDAPIRRLKWGTASLIVRAPVTPIVLPIVHHGFEKVMPENYMFGRRPPIPLCNKDINIVIGEPIIFDVPKLKHKALEMSRDVPFSHAGWPKTICGLDEAAQRSLYTTISEQIRGVMERLRGVSKSFFKTN